MVRRNYNPDLEHKSEPPWKALRFDYTSGNLDYMGKSLLTNPSTSTGNYWWIWKFSYDGSDNLTLMEGPLPGNWDDRSTLNWAT